MHQRLSLWIAGILCAVCIRYSNAQSAVEAAVSSQESVRMLTQSSARGFLIADGKFVVPPYQIGMTDDGKLNVNGTTYNLESRSEQFRFSGRPVFASRNSNRGPGGRGTYQSPADRLFGMLESDSLVILSEAQRELEVHYGSEVHAIVNALLDKSDASIDVIPVSIQSHVPELRSDVEFMARSGEFKSEIDAVEQRNRSSGQSVRWLDFFAYPLSLVGMLLVVFATGQLLLNRPPQGKELNEHSDEPSSSMTMFVTMIVAFSVLDLIWTILASHDGSMRELNPIGRHLIADPKLLICFKASTTGVAVAILIFLRSNRRVHLAAWWMCLLLTLLTARWLVFNSLLV